MSMEINGHEIEHNSSSGYEYTVHTYTCAHGNCHIRASAEYGARERIEELAEQFNCPSGANNCMRCGDTIDPTGEICKYCKQDLDVGELVYAGR